MKSYVCFKGTITAAPSDSLGNLQAQFRLIQKVAKLFEFICEQAVNQTALIVSFLSNRAVSDSVLPQNLLFKGAILRGKKISILSNSTNSETAFSVTELTVHQR